MTIETTTSYAVIAIVAALAMFGVVAITLVSIPLQMQQAEAAPRQGCLSSFPHSGGGGLAVNQSAGRCVR